MLTTIINPTYTAPTSSITNVSGIYEIGASVAIAITQTFTQNDAGAIVSQVINKDGAQASTTLTWTETLTIDASTTYNGTVTYADGPIKNNNIGTPYPTGRILAGTVTSTTRTITGVYPLFATTSSITVLTKQTLVAMNSTYFGVTVVAESGSDKQKVEIPTAWSAITGIQFYNTINNSWEYIGGSKANSLTTFTQSAPASKTYSTGLSTNYITFTHNGATIGARQLRFYTT